jgi:putative redox protein
MVAHRGLSAATSAATSAAGTDQVCDDRGMSDDNHRWIGLERVDEGVYRARNARGGELVFGSRAGEAFTPVELLLAAIAGCSAVDVDVVTGRRSPADTFAARVDAQVVRDEGNILTDITLTFQVTFPEGEAGDAARAILPRAVQTSHDRTCTVSRTIEAGTPVRVRID